MSERRRGPTAESKARAERIAAALEGLLEDPPAVSIPDPTGTDADPYRPRPALRSRPRPPAGLSCPGCRATMHLHYDRGLQLERCLQCGGIWLDPGELDEVGQQVSAGTADMQTLRREMAPMLRCEDEVRYRPCPRCSQAMDRVNFGEISGIIVDECRAHGVYLDPDELEAVERFIELGGIELGRKRSQERARERARDLENRTALRERSFLMNYAKPRDGGRAIARLFSWFDW